MLTYHAVYHRTSFTGDEPRAIFRYSKEAEDYAAKEAAASGACDVQTSGYTVEKVTVDAKPA